jgi:hypothetical protein
MQSKKLLEQYPSLKKDFYGILHKSQKENIPSNREASTLIIKINLEFRLSTSQIKIS